MNSFRGLARRPSFILPHKGEEIAFARLPWAHLPGREVVQSVFELGERRYLVRVFVDVD